MLETRRRTPCPCDEFGGRCSPEKEYAWHTHGRPLVRGSSRLALSRPPFGGRRKKGGTLERAPSKLRAERLRYVPCPSKKRLADNSSDTPSSQPKDSKVPTVKFAIYFFFFFLSDFRSLYLASDMAPFCLDGEKLPKTISIKNKKKKIY